MPEAQEVLSDDESESFRRTIELGITNVMATVRVPTGRRAGHNVVMATRGDGAVVWVDRVCQRATTPTFDARRTPFVDDVVTTWHNGEPVGSYDYAAQLVTAREAVKTAQQARRERDGQTTRKALRDAEAARVGVILDVLKRTNMPMREVAGLAGISMRTLYRIKAPNDDTR